MWLHYLQDSIGYQTVCHFLNFSRRATNDSSIKRTSNIRQNFVFLKKIHIAEIPYWIITNRVNRFHANTMIAHCSIQFIFVACPREACQMLRSLRLRLRLNCKANTFQAAATKSKMKRHTMNFLYDFCKKNMRIYLSKKKNNKMMRKKKQQHVFLHSKKKLNNRFI